MYTRHHVVYEIYNHEEGTITFFEHYENVERWEQDNEKNPNGYQDYGLRITTSAETDLWYKSSDKQN